MEGRIHRGQRLIAAVVVVFFLALSFVCFIPTTHADTVTLYAVDNNAEIWSAPAPGSTWSLVNADYNGGDGNASQDGLLISSSGALYAFRNTAVWRSTNDGMSWTQQTAAYGSSSNIQRVAIDSGDALYIIGANEFVWQSIDGGATWVQRSGDLNGGNGDILGFTAVGTTLYVVDSQADIWTSANSGTTWTAVNTDYNGGEADGGTDAMTADSSGNLFVLNNQSVWRSINNGTSWTQQTAAYGGGNALFIRSDTGSTLYIIDGTEDLWQSVNNGSSWTQVAVNFNAGSVNIGGFAIKTVSGTPTPTPSGSGAPSPTSDSIGRRTNLPAKFYFSGEAFPNAVVALDLLDERHNLLRNITSQHTDYAGKFLISIDEPVFGPHFYGFTLRDRTGKILGVKFYNYEVEANLVIRQSVIFPPTLVFNKKLLPKDESLVVSGHGSPGNTVQVIEGNEVRALGQVNNSAEYQIAVPLGPGGHWLGVRQVNEAGAMSDISELQLATVGQFGYASIDLNADGRVDIADWSIFLFNWSSANETVRLRDDLNGDGTVNVSDFSIFLTSFMGTQ